MGKTMFDINDPEKILDHIFRGPKTDNSVVSTEIPFSESRRPYYQIDARVNKIDAHTDKKDTNPHKE